MPATWIHCDSPLDSRTYHAPAIPEAQIETRTTGGARWYLLTDTETGEEVARSSHLADLMEEARLRWGR